MPEEEIRRLYELEEKLAGGRVQIDLESDHLKRIWGNDLNKRTLTELLTGIPSRGPGNTGTGGDGANTYGNNGVSSDIMRMAMLQQLLPQLRGMFDDILQ